MRCAKPTTRVCAVCVYSEAEYKFLEYNYKLLDIPRPKGPYMMMEINHVDKNKEKGYYMVELRDKREIKIVAHNAPHLGTNPRLRHQIARYLSLEAPRHHICLTRGLWIPHRG